VDKKSETKTMSETKRNKRRGKKRERRAGRVKIEKVVIIVKNIIERIKERGRLNERVRKCLLVYIRGMRSDYA
jgi:hypothetical protein